MNGRGLDLHALSPFSNVVPSANDTLLCWVRGGFSSLPETALPSSVSAAREKHKTAHCSICNANFSFSVFHEILDSSRKVNFKPSKSPYMARDLLLFGHLLSTQKTCVVFNFTIFVVDFQWFWLD